MWTIHCLVNTVYIPNECGHDLFNLAQDYEGEFWNKVDDVTEDGLLNFNPYHMEYMDYLRDNTEAIRILKAYNVKGDIRFGSLEGDNAGSFWGYHFDGRGGMKHLKGNLVWEENKSRSMEGKVVVITGYLPHITRLEAEEKVRESGGKVSKTVSKNTDLLVVGDNPGSKLEKAKRLGIETISGKDFLALLEE
ncbi:MAG: hypothetical protein HYT62_01445 [Candidatus Yanofskybacteria bacterium]|nr:hypothetical protein [Candidatus Yanofskybacteria bacterium]